MEKSWFESRFDLPKRTKNARRVVNDTLLTLSRVDERERKSREQWWLIRRATAFVLDTPTMPKESTARKSRALVTQPYQADEKTTTKEHNEVAWERFPSKRK
uniref:Uncharacterized protein n=1 Tax=Timema poppense TaxID=170557 RepID=A0A7R9CHP5_TIMPO|nr:unnamed protein product [Timema poppensis]